MESIPSPAQVLRDGGEDICSEPAKLPPHLPSSFHRIYVGDEFCPQRLPNPASMEGFFEVAERNGMGVTLLTPVLTDEELWGCLPLFDCLTRLDAHCEVMVNDWGVLSFLKERYPFFRLGAGRIFNKGFKDPRLKITEKGSVLTEDLMELLRYSTFSRPEFQHLLQELGVARMEQDMLPYSDRVVEGHPAFETSVYFPFGYVTSGRVCWTACFEQSPSRQFIPGSGCSRPCRKFTLELASEDFAFKVFQNGNTLFYLYTQAMLGSLLKEANESALRLVYQGLAI